MILTLQIEIIFGQCYGRARASSVSAEVVNSISPECQQTITIYVCTAEIPYKVTTNCRIR